MRRATILVVGIAAAAALAITYVAYQTSVTPRRDEIAQRGRLVMPFELERTTHTFQPTPEGGVQTVTADDPSDTEQVRLIREHLSEEASRFRNGDFDDPAFLHGEEMPGLGELRAGVDRMEIRYETTPAGARIEYVTADDALVQALHSWFEAQVSDHGDHAESHP